MKVYLAGPISSDPERHLDHAIDVANNVIDRGHNPYIPNMLYFLAMRKERDYETYMKLDEEWLMSSDAIYRIPGESPGADREMAVAEQAGILIIGSLTDLDWIGRKTL